MNLSKDYFDGIVNSDKNINMNVDKMSTLTKKSILNKMSICQNNINSPAHKTCYSAALKH